MAFPADSLSRGTNDLILPSGAASSSKKGKGTSKMETTLDKVRMFIFELTGVKLQDQNYFTRVNEIKKNYETDVVGFFEENATDETTVKLKAKIKSLLSRHVNEFNFTNSLSLFGPKLLTTFIAETSPLIDENTQANLKYLAAKDALEKEAVAAQKVKAPEDPITLEIESLKLKHVKLGLEYESALIAVDKEIKAAKKEYFKEANDNPFAEKVLDLTQTQEIVFFTELKDDLHNLASGQLERYKHYVNKRKFYELSFKNDKASQSLVIAKLEKDNAELVAYENEKISQHYASRRHIDQAFKLKRKHLNPLIEKRAALKTQFAVTSKDLESKISELKKT